MSEYIQNGTSLYKKVEPNKRVDYKTDIDEFEFKRTPETDTMLKQLCIKECFVRCKDCKYCDRHHLVDGLFCYRLYEKYNREYPQMIIEVDADDFCSQGEKR